MNVRELIISERLPNVFLDQLCCFWELLMAELLIPDEAAHDSEIMSPTITG